MNRLEVRLVRERKCDLIPMEHGRYPPRRIVHKTISIRTRPYGGFVDVGQGNSSCCMCVRLEVDNKSAEITRIRCIWYMDGVPGMVHRYYVEQNTDSSHNIASCVREHATLYAPISDGKT